MIAWVMFFGGGFLAATLLALMTFSVVHDRAVRITRRHFEITPSLSMVELNAREDRLRADFAISTQRLETAIERLRFKTTVQLGEIGRKSEAIGLLKLELAKTSATVAERAQSTTEKDIVIDRQGGEIAELASQVERHKLQIDRLLQHVEDLAHQRFDEMTAASAVAEELAQTRRAIELSDLQAAALQNEITARTHALEIHAARIAELETSLAIRDRSLSQRDAEMRQVLRAMGAKRRDGFAAVRREIPPGLPRPGAAPPPHA
jgi:hypothetical protein